MNKTKKDAPFQIDGAIVHIKDAIKALELAARVLACNENLNALEGEVESAADRLAELEDKLEKELTKAMLDAQNSST